MWQDWLHHVRPFASCGQRSKVLPQRAQVQVIFGIL
jgi:hypothetical protein